MNVELGYLEWGESALGYLEWRESHAERPVRMVFRRKLEITMILCDDLICLKSIHPLHLRQIVQPRFLLLSIFFPPSYTLYVETPIIK